VGVLAKTALEKGVSAYVGDGKNCWCAGHRDDAAKLYVLAAEKGKAGSIFHAVAEEGVPVKDIGTAIGKQLNVPVISLPPEKENDHFGWFHFGADNMVSSTKTRESLGWNPTGAGVMEDIPLAIAWAKSVAT
jgi:nucleoside-diphosphate-sugar epimerase